MNACCSNQWFYWSNAALLLHISCLNLYWLTLSQTITHKHYNRLHTVWPFSIAKLSLASLAHCLKKKKWQPNISDYTTTHPQKIWNDTHLNPQTLRTFERVFDDKHLTDILTRINGMERNCYIVSRAFCKHTHVTVKTEQTRRTLNTLLF